MSNDSMSLFYAVNYFLSLLCLVGGFVVVVIVGGIIAERVVRAACKRRHPASVGRRARIVAERRAKLNGRG